MKLSLVCFLSRCDSWLLSWVLLFSLTIGISCGQDKTEAVPNGIFRSKYVISVVDDAIHRSIMEAKANDRMDSGVGRSGLVLWCEVVVRSSRAADKVNSYFNAKLMRSRDGGDGQIKAIEIFEVRINGSSLEQLSLGFFDDLDLVDSISAKAATEIILKHGPQVFGELGSVFNYAFRLTCVNDEIYRRLEGLVAKEMEIPSDFGDDLEWGEVFIMSGSDEKAAFRVELLHGGKFRLFKTRVKNGGGIAYDYFGVMGSENIWVDLVQRMRDESPRIMEMYSDILGLKSHSDFNVLISTLVRDQDLSGRMVVTTIQNKSDSTQAILLWDTPFDSVDFARAFLVTEIGEDRPRMMFYGEKPLERGDPLESDYLIIGRGESITSVVDLNQAFKMKSGLEYNVRHGFSLKSFRVKDGKRMEKVEPKVTDIEGKWMTLKKRD